MTPQSTLVLGHLQRVGHISNVEANAVLKVRSVSRRITEIQRHGFLVDKTFKQDSTGQRYVKYTLVAREPLPAALATINVNAAGKAILDFSRRLFRAAA
jgi:hypothetical protein